MSSRSDRSGSDAEIMARLDLVMAGVDGSDFERFDPPAELWGRIATTIASARAGEPALTTKSTELAVEYCIDGDDVVVAVDAGWAQFARDNDAPELVTPGPERTLWSYFDGEEIRELWQLLVARVRDRQNDAHVSLRCDAPDARRWFDMTITPEADGKVRFRSVLVFEQPRPVVPLLHRHTPRDSGADAVPVCSWCGKCHDGVRWLDVEGAIRERRLLEESPVPAMSFGICPTCRDAMSAELLVPGTARGTSPERTWADAV